MPAAAPGYRATKLATWHRLCMRPAGQNPEVQRITGRRRRASMRQPIEHARFSPNPDHHAQDYNTCPNGLQSSNQQANMSWASQRFGSKPGRYPGSPQPSVAACVRACLLVAVIAQLWLLTAPSLAQWRPDAAAVGMRFGESGPRTRVVLDLDRSIRFDARVQTAPDRLVVDLGDVQWQPGSPTGQLRGLARAHHFDAAIPGRARLEVEMARPFRIVGAILLPPYSTKAACSEGSTGVILAR